MLLIKSPGIDASTVDSRSALKWECPKNVSGVPTFFPVCLIYKYELPHFQNPVVGDVSMWNSDVTLMIYCQGQV